MDATPPCPQEPLDRRPSGTLQSTSAMMSTDRRLPSRFRQRKIEDPPPPPHIHVENIFLLLTLKREAAETAGAALLPLTTILLAGGVFVVVIVSKLQSLGNKKYPG